MKEDLLEFVGMRNLGFQECLLSDEFREHLEKIGIHPRPSEVPVYYGLQAITMTMPCDLKYNRTVSMIG